MCGGSISEEISAGGDLKIGLSSNLRLDVTVNPDFGQVEVDTAVVNLSDVETYFQEKRPFFVEGAKTFKLGYGGANSFWSFNWSTPTIFYSRRAGPIQLWNPDFNFKSLRGNAVLRWEYRPGSTLYLVWTQSRSDQEGTGQFRFNRSFSRLWSARPDNIFMVKMTYWWSL